MLKLRYFIRLLLAFLKNFKGVLIIGILFGFVVFFSVRIIIPTFIESKTTRIGVNGRYQTDTLPDYIVDKISDGLTKIDDNGIPVPSLAESWETPDKGKTWIFHLKSDVYWQDGTKVTSDTINYEFTDVDIERPDDKTILFKLKNPFSPFPSVVSKPTFKSGLLGTKGWKVTKLIITGNYIQEIILNNNGNKYIYKFYPTLERTKLGLKLGEVDELIEMIDPSPFDKWTGITIETKVNKDQVATLFFNTQDTLLSEKSVRQALIYAINKDDLSESRALSPINPNSWAYNPQVKQYKYDKEKAKEIIDDLPDELKKDLNIKIVSSPYLLNDAEEISKYWNDIGVNSVVQVSSIIPSEFQVYLTIFDIPKDPDQYPIWHSTQTQTNISNYTNQRIDKLLEDGREVLDLEERRKIYLDFQRFLLEDVPAAFLYYPKYYDIKRN